MYTFTTTTATTTTIYLEKRFGIGPVDRLSWQPAATKSFGQLQLSGIHPLKVLVFTQFALFLFLLLTKSKSKQTLDITVAVTVAS